MPGLVADPIADIEVKIHYLIGGPFHRAPRSTVERSRLRPDHHSCEEQAVGEGRVLTTDVQIESDPGS
ncbi:MAG: hypothetical protein IPH20_14375 [Bacteroidales bacterium]|nr:hypothetical protein [Bacteroidales bacterium]